jgi:hypothetical protein
MSILNKKETDLPVTTDDLIKYSDKTFPTRTPQPSDSLSEIMYRSGQRSVIDFLKQKLNDQEV